VIIEDEDNAAYAVKKYGLVLDDYFLFGSVVCLVVFDVLLMLRTNGTISAKWGKIFIAFSCFVIFTSLFITKKIIKYLYLYLESKWQRYCLYVVHFFTLKAIIMIVIFASWKDEKPKML